MQFSFLLLFFFFLSVVCLAITRIFFFRSLKKFKQKYPNIEKFANLPSPYFIFIRISIYIIVLILLSFLFFQPLTIPQKSLDKEQKEKGVDILFLVDVSLSMQTTDVLPNRLKYFKQTLLEMLENLSGNRLGILAFSGKPFLYSPMTTDIASFSDYIKGLGVDMIGTRGTDIGLAFQKAKEILDTSRIFRNRLIVLVTDGENLESTKIPNFEQKTKFIIWGIGTQEGGNILYENEKNNYKGYVTKQGQISVATSNPNLIISKINLTFLEKLAVDNQGTFYWLNQMSVSAKQDLEKVVKSMEKNYYQRLKKAYESKEYRNFLLPIFLLLFLDFILFSTFAFWKEKDSKKKELRQ